MIRSWLSYPLDILKLSSDTVCCGCNWNKSNLWYMAQTALNKTLLNLIDTIWWEWSGLAVKTHSSVLRSLYLGFHFFQHLTWILFFMIFDFIEWYCHITQFTSFFSEFLRFLPAKSKQTKKPTQQNLPFCSIHSWVGKQKQNVEVEWV